MSRRRRALWSAGITLALAGCTTPPLPEPTAPHAADSQVVVALLDAPVAALPDFDCVRLVQRSADPVTSDHGTQVASVVTGVARGACPGPRLVLRVYDIERNGKALPSLVISAIDSAASRDTDVIAISATFRKSIPALQRAIADAVADDAIVVAPAGNSAGLPAAYPAAYPGVISVGSLAPSGELSDFSARGGITVAAPGEHVPALRADGTITEVTGTSFAAALIAGEAAAHLLHGADHADTKRFLNDTNAYERTP